MTRCFRHDPARQRRQSQSQSGFTLVELLVALFVFSLIAVAGVGMLRSSADSQVILKEKLNDRAAILRTANLLEADLAQAIERPVRERAGAMRPAFEDGSSAAGQLFAFTRTGAAIGAEPPAPSIARVHYHFAAGNLERSAAARADGAEALPPARLLEGLRNVSVRYRDQSGNWRSDWSAADGQAMPRALELILDFQQGPSYRLVMLVGSQLRPVLPEGLDAGDAAPDNAPDSGAGVS